MSYASRRQAGERRGNGDVDCDLQFRPVELNERPFDELVFVGPRIDEHRIVGHIGCDPDIGRLRPARSALAYSASSSVLSAATGTPPNCAAAVPAAPP
jgi:hypothetical protein